MNRTLALAAYHVARGAASGALVLVTEVCARLDAAAQRLTPDEGETSDPFASSEPEPGWVDGGEWVYVPDMATADRFTEELRALEEAADEDEP